MLSVSRAKSDEDLPSIGHPGFQIPSFWHLNKSHININNKRWLQLSIGPHPFDKALIHILHAHCFTSGTGITSSSERISPSLSFLPKRFSTITNARNTA